MSDLLRAELTRLRWRRAVLVLLVVAFVIPGIVLASEIWNTRPITEADRTRAEAEIARMVDSMQPEIEQCLRKPRRWGAGPDADEAACREAVVGEISVEDWIYRPALRLGDVVEGAGVATVTVLALLAALAGTTFAGHDWASGSMSNQLLFEPRRGRVWAAKAGALLLATSAVTVVVLGLFWATLGATAASRGITTTAETWSRIGVVGLRAVVLVGLAALTAYALTMLFRSTVASLGLVFGVVLLSSVVILSVLGPRGEPWILPGNAAAFLLGEYEYYLGGDCFMGDCDQLGRVSFAHGATYLGSIAAAAVSLGWWSFTRRDVP